MKEKHIKKKKGKLPEGEVTKAWYYVLNKKKVASHGEEANCSITNFSILYIEII